MIEREMVQQFFADLQELGVDPKQKMKWLYFFSDERSSDKLRAVVPKLEQDGYQFVSIDMTEPGGEPVVLDGRTFENPPLYVLQVQKIESHTIDSLHSRNQQLESFAEDTDLFSYDGMSVGTETGAPLR
jgi:Regulator of ribonuclease activity B